MSIVKQNGTKGVSSGYGGGIRKETEGVKGTWDAPIKEWVSPEDILWS